MTKQEPSDEASAFDSPMMSRTGTVSPLGTLTQELKTKVDIDTELAFRRKCSEAHTDVAGALRDYVCKVVHGKTFEELSYEASQHRRALLLPEGLIEGLRVPQSGDGSAVKSIPRFLRAESK